MLDLGCASGEIALDLAPHVQHIDALDVSPKMTRRATQKATSRNITNASFIRNGRFLSNDLSLSTVLNMLWTTAFSRKKAIFAATGLRPSVDQIKDMNILKALIEDGTLETSIDRSYSFDNIAKAHHYVEHGRKRGNVVITVYPQVFTPR